nr:hypothetical protein [Streptomyces sp. NRRL F-5727]
MPGDGPVVVIVVEDGQSVVSGGGCDDQADGRGAPVLAGSRHPALYGVDPAAGVLAHRDIGVELGEHLGDLVVLAAVPGAVQELGGLGVARRDRRRVDGVVLPPARRYGGPLA